MSSAVEPDRRCWLASPDSRPYLSCSSRSKCHALDSRGEAGQTMRRDQDELALQHRRDSPSSQNADPTRALTWSRLCCRKKQASPAARGVMVQAFQTDRGQGKTASRRVLPPPPRVNGSRQAEQTPCKVLEEPLLSAPPTSPRPGLRLAANGKRITFPPRCERRRHGMQSRDQGPVRPGRPTVHDAVCCDGPRGYLSGHRSTRGSGSCL